MSETIYHLLKLNFPQLEDSLIKEISECAVIKEFEPGTQIMKYGQYIRSSILMVKGRVKVYREGPEGEAFFLYDIDPGTGCALSMICAAKNETSELNAIVAEDTTAIMIPSDKMDEFMRNYKSWYHFVLQTYRQRLDELINVIENIAFKSMDERLIYYLNNLSQKNKSAKIHLTHQEIANDLNSSREVISRLLKKMEKNGWLSLERNQINLLKDIRHIM